MRHRAARSVIAAPCQQPRRIAVVARSRNDPFMNHVLSVSTSASHIARQRRLSRYDRPGTMVGHTPVLHIAAPFTIDDRGFWAKLEAANPGGSMKDLSLIHI